MKDKKYFKISGLIFLSVAILHFLRVINGWDIYIGTFLVPNILSWAAIILVGYLGYHALTK